MDQTHELDGKRILITGGYGEVGRRLAARLAPDYPERVVVAGRDGRRAAALADSLNGGVRALQLDVNDPAAIERALDGIAVVVNCIDQREPHLLRAAVDHGLAYTDVSASLIWRTALTMRERAEQRGARVVIGAGLAPGISSVMVRAAAEQVDGAHAVHVALLFSIGDAFGPAALEYLLSEIPRPFVITENGSQRTVRCNLLRIGAGSLLAHAVVRQAIIRSVGTLHKAYQGSDEFAVVVEVDGRGTSKQLSLVGRDQSEATAIGAALIARALYDGGAERAGVWCAEEVIAPAPFFDALAQLGLRVTADP